MMWITNKINSEYNKVKNIFKAPRKTFFFGLAKNSPCGFGSTINWISLPLWLAKLFGVAKEYKLNFLNKTMYNTNIALPWWTSIRLERVPVSWKYKYDDIRFEYVPFFRFQFLWFEFSIEWHSPLYKPHWKSNSMCDMCYYESILTYLHDTDSNKTIEERILDVNDKSGYWRDQDKTIMFACNTEFVKDEKLIKILLDIQDKTFKAAVKDGKAIRLGII